MTDRSTNQPTGQPTFSATNGTQDTHYRLYGRDFYLVTARWCVLLFSKKRIIPQYLSTNSL